MIRDRVRKLLLTSLCVLASISCVLQAETISAKEDLINKCEVLEKNYIAAISQKTGTGAAAKEYDSQTKGLFLDIIRGLKKDTPERIDDFRTFLEHVKTKRAPDVLAYVTVSKYIVDKLKIDLTVCQGINKPEDVKAKIKGYLDEATSLHQWVSSQHTELLVNSASSPSSPANPAHKPLPTTKNTSMDKIKGFFDKLKETLGFHQEPLKVYTTYDGAKTVFTYLTNKISDEYIPLDTGMGNRSPRKAESKEMQKPPNAFFPSTNNFSDQFSQGMAFAKLKELIERTVENRRKGVTKGVFILVHNFIVSGEETAQKMADLLVLARKAGVPVLLSYDQFGTHVYASGALPVIDRLKKAGVGVLSVKPFQGERMDHRKIYFFGTGDGHVMAMAGGQGWCDQYGGPDWDKLTPVSEKDGCLLYPVGKEPWVDHMRLLDGEGALQGVVSYLGRFGKSADKGILTAGLGLTDTSDPGKVSPRLWEIFYPELKTAGNLTALILTNVSWDQRPITEEWYKNLSDPDVQDIRIAQPYITDPVFRTKLRQAVRDGKNIKILIPGMSDNFLSQYATKYLFADLREIHQKLTGAGKAVGKLELREWQSANKVPQMLHMKYGIFIHRDDNSKDSVLDGSYNATAVEARSSEVNADILLIDHRAAVEAAATFDDYFSRAKVVDFTKMDKLRGAPVAFILRPFM